MLMITPAPDCLSCGMQRRVTSNVAVRLTCTTLSHSAGSSSSVGTVGPEMPTLLTSTSKPPSAFNPNGITCSMSSRFETSQTAVVTAGSSFAKISRALASTSQTKTWAPVAANARTISRPIPDAPAVTSTRRSIHFLLCERQVTRTSKRAGAERLRSARRSGRSPRLTGICSLRYRRRDGTLRYHTERGLALKPLVNGRDPLTAADAHRDESVLAVDAPQFVDHFDREDRPGRSDRMAERDPAAVFVGFCRIEAQLVGNRAGLRGKGLVGLDHVNLIERHAGFLQRRLDGRHGPDAHDFRIDAGVAVGDEPRQRFVAAGFRRIRFHQDDGSSGIVHSRGVSGCHRSVFAKDRLELLQAGNRRVGAHVFVRVENDRAL